MALGAVTSGDDSHHDRCWSAVGTGAVSDAHPGRYSTNTATPTLSLSEAYASGAMGLEAFVGQRGR